MKLRETVEKMNELNDLVEWLRVEITEKYKPLRGSGILITVHSHYQEPTISIHDAQATSPRAYHIRQGGIVFKVSQCLEDDPRVDIIISEILQMEGE